MAGKSDYLEAISIKHSFGLAHGYASPSAFYCALYSVAPTDAGGGTELTGGGYARVGVPNSGTWAWSGGRYSNANPITFASSTADWLPVVAIGLLDAATGGNLMFWGDMVPPTLIYLGSRFSIPVGAFQLVES